LSEEPCNITEEQLDKIMASMPKELSESELSALVVTLYNAYGIGTAETISSLLVVIYMIGEAGGYSKAFISKGLRKAADAEDAYARAIH